VSITQKDIVAILWDYQDELSDGYGYYCNDPDAKLREIAKKILKEV